ncbi:MAG: tripartite tricarboxylate transporter TctB family protein [Xanthobacteraceae bacterium]
MRHAAFEFLARRGRGVWSLLLFVLALALLLALNAQTHFRSAPEELGPRFWPRLCLAAMLVLTALDAALAFWATRRPSGAIDGAAAAARAPESMGLLFAGLLLVIAYAVATVVVGFPLATVLFLVAFSYLGGYRHMPSLLVIAFGSTLVLLYIFVYLVYVSLPLGVSPFLEMNVALYRLLGIF